MRIKSKFIVTGLALLFAGIMAGGARLQRFAVPAGPPLDDDIRALLEQHIPFAIEPLVMDPAAEDLFAMDILVQLDELGRDLDFTWRAMDGESVLLECGDFYDLFYRCEAPSRLNVRVRTIDHTGRQISIKHGLIAIN